MARSRSGTRGRDVGLPPEDGVEVHFGEDDPLVAHLLARDDLEVADPGLGLRRVRAARRTR